MPCAGSGVPRHNSCDRSQPMLRHPSEQHTSELRPSEESAALTGALKRDPDGRVNFPAFGLVRLLLVLNLDVKEGVGPALVSMRLRCGHQGS